VHAARFEPARTPNGRGRLSTSQQGARSQPRVPWVYLFLPSSIVATQAGLMIGCAACCTQACNKVPYTAARGGPLPGMGFFEFGSIAQASSRRCGPCVFSIARRYDLAWYGQPSVELCASSWKCEASSHRRRCAPMSREPLKSTQSATSDH
jgi:hypothetical protein